MRHRTNASSLPAGLATDNHAGTSVRVSDLKQRTGLTWSQIAALFGVSCRAVHHWAEGGNMAAANAARLDELCEVVDTSGCTTEQETNRWLFSASPGTTHSRYSALVEMLPGYARGSGRQLIGDVGTGVEPHLAVTGKADNIRSLDQKLRDF